MNGSERGWRHFAPRLALLAVSLAFMDVASCAVGRKLQDHWLMYRPPVAAPGAVSYDEYMAKRDPVLGWHDLQSRSGETQDASGARPCPAFPDPEDDAPLAVYGDSFAYGEEVSHEEAWSNLLARRTGRRVANFGVPGFGTDQALLRYIGHDHDADVVILTLLTENVVRNATRSLDLLSCRLEYAQKPRYVLADDGTLTLVPLPVLDETSYRRALGLAEPFLDLPHENFQIGGPSGAVRLRFPYTLSILRNLGDFRMRARMKGIPRHAVFYEDGATPDPLPVTRAIVARFVDEAESRGQRALVVMLPTREDIDYRREHGAWLHGDFLRSLLDAGLPVTDLCDAIAGHVGQGGTEGLFRPGGHYGPELNAAFAEAVDDLLRAATD